MRVAARVRDLLGEPPGVNIELDRVSLLGLISRPYAPTPPHSLFTAIQSGQIGTRVVGDAGSLAFVPEWDLTAIPVRSRASLEACAGQVRLAILEAVGRLLPTGTAAATLSSGMDSASILAGAVAHGADVVAITWSSPTVPEADESKWARITAEHLDVPLIEMAMHPDTLLPAEGIVTHWWTPELNMFEKAWSDTATVLAQRGVDTLFAGLGGDHLFQGSASPAVDMLVNLRLRLLSRHLAARRPWYRSRVQMLRREFTGPLAKQVLRRRWINQQTPEPWLHERHRSEWSTLLLGTIGPGVLPGRAARLGGLLDGMVPHIAEYYATTMGDRGITTVDPFLERDVVEAALSIPAWWLDHGTSRKLVLREAMRGLLPDEILTLEKIYPAALARAALRARSSQLQGLTKDMRLAEMELVDEQVLSQYVKAFMRREHDSMAFWNTLTLEDWLRRWR